MNDAAGITQAEAKVGSADRVLTGEAVARHSEQRGALTVNQEADDLISQRKAKLARLVEAGFDPWPTYYRRTHTAAEAVSAFDDLAGQEVRVAGRMLTVRDMGKATFAHIVDGSGRIQIYFRQNVLGEDRYRLIRNFDLGDIIGVEGALFRTRTGEVTVEVHEYTLLAKALRPPPEKWHGLMEVEKRYRQRYLDLMANPDVRDVFVRRSAIIRAMRDFLDQRGFIEVETPILQPIYGGGAARPFETYHQQLDRQLYLRIASELYLKRLLVGGLDKVYEIGKNFRNEGVSFKHNPEFTVMESYEAYADYLSVMDMVEQMIPFIAQAAVGSTTISCQGHQIDLKPPWRRVTLRQAIIEYAGLDFEEYPSVEALAAKMQAMNVEVPPGLNRGKLIDELQSKFVEPHLIQPTYLLDYPVEVSPLAKRRSDNPRLVERFEAFIGGMEIGNAFSELNDPQDQRQRFEEQVRARTAGDEEAQPMDEDYVTALEYGMPPAGGLGVGVDRLVMLLTDRSSIREVILFPQLRTKD